MPISPEEKQRHLINKWGLDTTRERIAELIATKKAHSKLSAVDRLYQEIQWEPIETNAILQGFYLGSYTRGPPGGQQTRETYLLTKDGPQLVRFAEEELLDSLEQAHGQGRLAPIELSGVDRAKNIETDVVALQATRAASIKRINLSPQLLDEWANRIDQVTDTPKPFFLSQPIFSVRDVVPSEGWQDAGGGRRQRVTGVPPLPVVNNDGEVNLRLSLGGDSVRVSYKILNGEELLRLLDPEDISEGSSPKEWSDWIQASALKDHEKVMTELRSFEGRRLVVFGMGGSEIQVKDAETQQRKTVQLSGSFITSAQIGFLMTWHAASTQVEKLGEGEQVIAPRPSAAAPPAPIAKPSQPAPKGKSARDAILDLIAEKGGSLSREEMKALAGSYGIGIVEDVNALIAEGVIRVDTTTKRYVKSR